MRRRDFITLLGGAAAQPIFWPLAAGAQQPKMPLLGILNSSTSGSTLPYMAAFLRGLNETGYIEGRNVTIEYHWADDDLDRLPAMAADLVRRPVSLLAVLGDLRTALAAKAATASIPVVFAIGADPLVIGLVASLNRPGGNITGITQLAGAVVTKRMQLLHDIVPNAKVFGVLRNPDNNTKAIVDASIEAAKSLGGSVQIVDARSEADFEPAFARLAQGRADALNALPNTLFSTHAERLAVLATRYAIPAIFAENALPRVGGLMSYNADQSEVYRQAGAYAGRILKGEKPADLPVMQPTKFDLVINLKTARTLGLTVPPSLLAIADEVIE
jgi:putative tryptophan/tyrosine transport system substrate-binding protein